MKRETPLRERLFIDNSTGKSLDYSKWCAHNKLFDLLSVEADKFDEKDIKTKAEHGLYDSFRTDIPYPPEFDDLTRLHFIARNRRATTILEFGCGKSTIVFADALKQNKQEYGSFVSSNLRRANPFELHSVDQSREWIMKCKEHLPKSLNPLVQFHFSPVAMSTFEGRACTFYDHIPNICPDIIYLDGPDQFNVAGDVHGVSTRTTDRLPMSADILLMEHFLLPGSLILVDGRTANARFLKCNLQREWDYCHLEEEDIHAFELVEKPLGKINRKQIDFMHGIVG